MAITNPWSTSYVSKTLFPNNECKRSRRNPTVVIRKVLHEFYKAGYFLKISRYCKWVSVAGSLIIISGSSGCFLTIRQVISHLFIIMDEESRQMPHTVYKQPDSLPGSLSLNVCYIIRPCYWTEIHLSLWNFSLVISLCCQTQNKPVPSSNSRWSSSNTCKQHCVPNKTHILQDKEPTLTLKQHKDHFLLIKRLKCVLA